MVQTSLMMNGDVIAVVSLIVPHSDLVALRKMFQLVWSSMDEIDESKSSSGQRLCFKAF